MDIFYVGSSTCHKNNTKLYGKLRDTWDSSYGGKCHVYNTEHKNVVDYIDIGQSFQIPEILYTTASSKYAEKWLHIEWIYIGDLYNTLSTIATSNYIDQRT